MLREELICTPRRERDAMPRPAALATDPTPAQLSSAPTSLSQTAQPFDFRATTSTPPSKRHTICGPDIWSCQ